MANLFEGWWIIAINPQIRAPFHQLSKWFDGLYPQISKNIRGNFYCLSLQESPQVLESEWIAGLSFNFHSRSPQVRTEWGHIKLKAWKLEWKALLSIQLKTWGFPWNNNWLNPMLICTKFLKPRATIICNYSWEKCAQCESIGKCFAQDSSLQTGCCCHVVAVALNLYRCHEVGIHDRRRWRTIGEMH